MVKVRLLLILLTACFSATGGCLGQIASWYKSYNVSIDKYPIIISLHKTGHKYAGYYYHSTRKEQVYFIGDDSTGAGNINSPLFFGIRKQMKNSDPLTEGGLYEDKINPVIIFT
jgi:hypothetical protein